VQLIYFAKQQQVPRSKQTAFFCMFVACSNHLRYSGCCSNTNKTWYSLFIEQPW